MSVFTARMTSVIAFDGVTSFQHLKDVKKGMYKYAKQSEVWLDFYSAMAESWKKPKTSNLFSSFIMSSNRNR